MRLRNCGMMDGTTGYLTNLKSGTRIRNIISSYNVHFILCYLHTLHNLFHLLLLHEFQFLQILQWRTKILSILSDALLALLYVAIDLQQT